MDPLLLLLIIILFFVPTILMMRKQRKQQEEIRGLQNSLSVGDTVVTAGGLFGSVVAAADDRVALEIAPGVVVQWDRAGILRREETVPADEEPAVPGEGESPAGEPEAVDVERPAENDDRPSR